MEEEFDYTNVPVASMDDFYTPDKEEEELDEFGNSSAEEFESSNWF